MTAQLTRNPIVMSITDHDPCGGAGVSAAIETIASLGCHCTPVITKLTARDTTGEKDFQITETHLLIEQIRAILEDMPVNAIVIGDLASTGNTEALYTILQDYPQIPVVLNYASTANSDDPALKAAIKDLLLPVAEIAILSQQHLLSMACSADTISACAQEMLASGCQNILITGTKEQQIQNYWFSQHGQAQSYQWDRYDREFQGAADTLLSAVGAYLAHGLTMAESLQQAQKFTQRSLQNHHRMGMGKCLPNRLHWTEN